AFGEPVRLEVHGLSEARADAALRDAFDAIRGIEELTDPDLPAEGGGLADLNAAAGGAPVVLHPDLLDLLSRAHHFCVWSEGAHGPLGGNLYTLWGLRGPTPGIPPAPRVEQAAEEARCDRLKIDPATGRAQLAAGARADLHGFARGFAVDRAIEVLRSHGADEAFVSVGWVWRALGAGPDGRGWRLVLPDLPGDAEGADTLVLDPLRLTSQAAAAASALHRPLVVGGERFAPWIDQRSGQPAEGVVATVAVSELAVDAEALAATMLVLGNRQGSLRAGVLEPQPSVLWLLGSGEGVPMLAPVRWGRVTENHR
ncbi:MAG TPA: FAD:protein FMN transferase, partial [Thermoanaerobaculia bacterium]|nr:FAD:protein FMN transferase [Thermoanaerobaculia bacterium]